MQGASAQGTAGALGRVNLAKQQPILHRQLDELAKSIASMNEAEVRFEQAVNRLTAAPPKPVTDNPPQGRTDPITIELRLDQANRDMQDTAQCFHALAERLETIV